MCVYVFMSVYINNFFLFQNTANKIVSEGLFYALVMRLVFTYWWYKTFLHAYLIKVFLQGTRVSLL